MSKTSPSSCNQDLLHHYLLQAQSVSLELQGPRSRRWREPEGEVAHVAADVRSRLRLAPHALSFRLRDEGRRPAPGIPVVVREVVEARVSNAASEKVPLLVERPIEGDDEIESAAGHEARPLCHDPRALLAGWHPDR